MSNFKLIKEVTTHGIPHQVYQSSASGLQVILSKVQSPMVEGAFVLATEAHDNDGCPHTLEHLVFMGSELYPYKGVLDGLANRCLAQGTNAWTDTDHTAYTLSTAGQEGFLNLLPIYLDHILYCKIQDSGFTTEVHHINGEGEDAGVVYCEMQGRENSASDLIYRKLLTTMWGPPEQCGYSSETGGRMSNLRNLTADTVRKYHQDYYRPDNFCLMISGQVDEKNLLAVLDKFEKERILTKPKPAPMKRPWVTSPCPPFPQSIDDSIQFPADDESTGSIIAGWRTTKYEDFESSTALGVLWSYLTDSPISPLSQALIETAEPYCTSISTSSIGGTENLDYIRFSDVDLKKQSEVKKVFFSTLNQLAEKGFDLDRMRDILQRDIVKTLSSIEEIPHQWQFKLIGHFLYGTALDQLEPTLNEVPILKMLLEKDNSFWVDLMKKYILSLPYAWIEGKPSIEYGKKLAQDEKDRIQKQVETLGKEKLQQLGRELEAAMKNNQQPIPPEIFSAMPIPDAGKIPFIPVSTIRNDQPADNNPNTIELAKSLSNDSSDSLGFFVEFDHIPSNFVSINLHIDTTKTLSQKLRAYLELYLDVMFKLPVNRQGKLLSQEEIVATLQRGTVSYGNDAGFGGSDFSCGSFAQLAVINMQVEISKYQESIDLLRDILNAAQFTPQYIKTSASKLLNSIPALKRRGEKMIRVIGRDNIYSPDSNHVATSIYQQEGFLKGVLKRLEDPEETKALLGELEEFRTALLNPNHFYLQISSDFTKLKNAKTALKTFLPPELTKQINKAENNNCTLSSAFRKESKVNQIFGIGSIENSYLFQVGKGIQTYEDKDIAPLMVLIEYLSGMEGPFWNEIRGAGLAYGYGLFLRIEEGFLGFSLSKSSNVTQAYERAKEIVTKIEFEQLAIEAARSSCIFEVVLREENMHNAAVQRLLTFFKKTSTGINQTLLTQIQNVSKQDLERVMKGYVLPLFDQKNNIFLSTNPSKISDIQEGFRKLNITIEERN